MSFTGVPASDEILCRELVDLATPYLDGALPADERVLVDAHLDSCDGCRTYLEQMRLTIRATGHIPEGAIVSRTRDEVLAIFRAWRRRRTW